MLQIKNIQGQSILEITDIVAVQDSPLIEFNVIVSQDSFHAVMGIKTELTDIQTLEERLFHLYKFEYKEIVFDSMDSKLCLRFFLEENYHIRVTVILYNNNINNSCSIRLEFNTDQTLLFEFIQNLSLIGKE